MTSRSTSTAVSRSPDHTAGVWMLTYSPILSWPGHQLSAHQASGGMRNSESCSVVNASASPRRTDRPFGPHSQVPCSSSPRSDVAAVVLVASPLLDHVVDGRSRANDAHEHVGYGPPAST